MGVTNDHFTKDTIPTGNVTTVGIQANSTPHSSSTPAKIGDTIKLGGNNGLSITLVRIIDPAEGTDEYNTPSASKHLVAVDVKIVNDGTSAFQDNANNNITLIGSDNHKYTNDIDSVSECTNFNYGDYTLSAGSGTTGCVVFQVPNGVSAAKVQFENSLHDVAEWVAW